MSKFLGIYLFLLSVLIGFELFAGIAVAPAIFHPENSVGTGVLSQFQSGQIMSGIFIKMNKFRQIHSASELCIKILLVLQVVLFFIKFQTIKMAKSDEI